MGGFLPFPFRLPNGSLAQIAAVPGATRMRQLDPLRTFARAGQLNRAWPIGERLLWRGKIEYLPLLTSS
jgi:hypothetical protein